MPFRSFVLCFIFLILTSKLATTAQPRTGQCAQNALAFAYEYGFPLYAYGHFVRPLPITPHTNTVYNTPTLATPASKGVVRPNVDTLYSIIFYDVSKSDLVFTTPDFDPNGDRYWVFPFYDMYANDYANVGSVLGHKPGKYLLRYTSSNFGLQTEDVVEAPYLGYINSPTPYGLCLVRILLKNNGTDLKTANKLQSQIAVTPVTRRTSAPMPNVPPMSLSMFSTEAFTPSKSVPLESAVLKMAAFLGPHNPPEVLQDRPWVSTLLATVGLSTAARTFHPPTHANLTLAALQANISITAPLTTAGLVQQLGNNWTQPSPLISGDFTSFYTARYYIALVGYLQLTPEQALYPSYSAPGSSSTPGNFRIGPNEAYLFTFSGKPKLKKSGFWSLTAYGADQYLIENERGVYAVGDRSNLTYSDGVLLGNREEGAFQVVVQPADKKPGGNWTGK